VLMQEGQPILPTFLKNFVVRSWTNPFMTKNCMRSLEFLRFGNIIYGQKNLSSIMIIKLWNT
jgi:hypothetical protein